METLSATMDAGQISDGVELATWNRPRTSEELQDFIITHHNMLPDGIEIE